MLGETEREVKKRYFHIEFIFKMSFTPKWQNLIKGGVLC